MNQFNHVSRKPDNSIEDIWFYYSDYQIAAFGKNVDNIIMPGWIDAAQIRVLMEMSIGGLAPFKKRIDFLSSIPNKVIEYLSAGLPVISGIDGEIKQLIDQYDCGVVYQEGDIDALTSIFELISLDHKKRKYLSKQAVLTYRNEFEFQQVYGDYADYVLNQIQGEKNNC